MFYIRHKHHFNLTHCLKILNDSAKWIDRLEKEEEKKRLQAVFKSTSGEGGEDEGSKEPTSGLWPLGCKSSKKKTKRKISVEDAAEEFHKRINKITEQREENRKMMSYILDYQKKTLESSIAAID